MKISFPLALCRSLFAVLALTMSVSDVTAAVRTWTGASASSGNWSTSANWDAGAPVAGDVLSFPDTGARKASNTNNLPAGTIFSSINLFGGGYRLRGNSVTVSNYVSAGNPAGTNTIDLDITAAGPGVGLTLRSFASAARLTLNGDLQLNARTLVTEGPGNFVVGGVIAGTGGIFKANTGDLSLSGAGANTFTGPTVVSAGTLRLNRYTTIIGGTPGLQVIPLFNAIAIPGDLIIGAGTGGLTADIVVLERDHQIANTSHVTVNGSGSLELSDENDTIGDLTLTAGFVTTGTGTLTLGGPVTVNLGTEDAVINGRLDLGAGTERLFDVAQGAELTINAQITGAAGISLVKSNRGTLTLTASNLFQGPVNIVGGDLTITHGSALGTADGPTRPTLGRLRLGSSIGVTEPLEVPGPSGTLELISGSATWVGNVRLDDDLNISVPTNGAISINGLISGPGGWFKYGPGTLQFKTTSTNTYTGTGTLREGDLILDGVFHQPVISGPLVIGYTNDAPGRERVAYIKQHQIADTVPITINRSGVLALQFVDDTVGPITLNGGAIDTGSGTLTLNGDILANATNAIATISGRLSLGGVTRTIATLGHANTPDLLVNASIADGPVSAGFNKVGEGELQLTASNTFSGTVLVTDGALRIGHSNALGSAISGTTVTGGDGAQIITESNLVVSAEPLSFSTTNASVPAWISGDAVQWHGAISLLADTLIQVPNQGTTLFVYGPVSGPGGLTKLGRGTLRFNGSASNIYGGTTWVREGTMALYRTSSNVINGPLVIDDGLLATATGRVLLERPDQIQDLAPVTINTYGSLFVTFAGQDVVGSLAGTGQLEIDSLCYFGAGRSGASTSFAGPVTGNVGAAFEKLGAGVMTITANPLQVTEIRATEGALLVNSTNANVARVLVNRPRVDNQSNLSAGTLGGSFTLGNLTVWADGVISPGNSPGQLTPVGWLLLSNSVYRVELNGAGAGSAYDHLRVSGTNDLGNSRLEVTLGYTPAVGDRFVIITNTGVALVHGRFAGLPQGARFSAGTASFAIDYTGGDGNEVILTCVPTPTNQITSIAAITAERIQIRGQGAPNLSYVLEATPHLNAPIPWAPIATNNANGTGLYEFIEPFFDLGAPLHPQRFFRVKGP